jgi:hypothetical protein
MIQNTVLVKGLRSTLLFPSSQRTSIRTSSKTFQRIHHRTGRISLFSSPCRQLIRYSDPDQPLWPTAIDRIAAQPDAPKWLARFRQGNCRDAAPQTDALSALKSSVRIVRGGILSEGMAGTSSEPSLEGGFREEGTAEAAAEGTSSMQLDEPEAAETKPAVGDGGPTFGELASGSVEGSGTGASSTPVGAITVGASEAEKPGGGAQGEGGEPGAVSTDGAEALGKYLGLQIKMILPSSCYATMAIRELLKSSTSVGSPRPSSPLFLLVALLVWLAVSLLKTTTWGQPGGKVSLL